MNATHVRTRISLILLPWCFAMFGYDNAQFYRATSFFSEPRLERSSLTSIDVIVGARSTNKSRNDQGTSVALFDLYGTHNMQLLGVGVPGKDPVNNNLDLILDNLAALPARCNFGMFSIEGSFVCIETDLIFTQNIKHGFFVQAYLPVINLEVKHARLKDLSPQDTEYPNINTPEWQDFLANFDGILKRYGLSKKTTDRTDVGDLVFSLGWTRSYQESKELDFIDVTFMAGVLIPTSKTRDEDKIFSLATGNDGHFGFPLSAYIALGAYEWLTFGGHLEVIPFTRKTRCIRLKTALAQSGIIKLAMGQAHIDRGTMLSAGGYLKADHFCRGLSLTIGYTFARKGNDTVIPCDSCFDIKAASSDEMRARWIMHTIHWGLDYNFARPGCCTGLRIGLFYDWNLGGKHIFQTDRAGCTVGLDMVWDF